MLRPRIIPCLLLQQDGLVKTRRFRNPKYVGDPINAIRIFNEKEVDELIVLDIQASRNGDEPQYELIAELAGECFMPLCYGGGVRTPEQARRLFDLGVEKVAIQTAALDDLGILGRIAEQAGSQAVVASIDVKSDWLGRRRLHASARACFHQTPWQRHLGLAQDAGAGEILLTNVDRDGEMTGLDTALVGEAAALARVPLIAAGGAADLGDIGRALGAGAAAVAAGALFVYQGPHRAVLITYPTPAEIDLHLSVPS
jgi:cyclase